MTNDQSMSYAILAMKDAGLDKNTILQVIEQMKWQMDIRTEEEAEKRADKYSMTGA